MIKILRESHNTILIFIIPLILILIGFAVYRDYGISLDEEISRNNGLVSIKYICDFLFPHYSDNFELIKNVPDIKNYGFEDNRGSLARVFCNDYFSKLGWNKPISQINYTSTKNKGTFKDDLSHFEGDKIIRSKKKFPINYTIKNSFETH